MNALTTAPTPQPTGTPETNQTQANMDKVADRVVIAVVATIIVQSGSGLLAALARKPWFMFGAGIAAGYLAHKHRREIIALSNHAADQGGEFVARQQRGAQALLQRLTGAGTGRH